MDFIPAIVRRTRRRTGANTFEQSKVPLLLHSRPKKSPRWGYSRLYFPTGCAQGFGVYCSHKQKEGRVYGQACVYEERVHACGTGGQSGAAGAERRPCASDCWRSAAVCAGVCAVAWYDVRRLCTVRTGCRSGGSGCRRRLWCSVGAFAGQLSAVRRTVRTDRGGRRCACRGVCACVRPRDPPEGMVHAGVRDGMHGSDRVCTHSRVHAGANRTVCMRDTGNRCADRLLTASRSSQPVPCG